MAVNIFVLNKVGEADLVETVKKACDDDPSYVTAINDGQGGFSVETTVITDDADSTITFQGKMSHFGGPNDPGVKPDEGLAIMDPSDVAKRPDLFLPTQPPGTTGTARRLNPDASYIACRWDYNVTPKSFLKTTTVTVSNPANGRSGKATPVDWGPNAATGRVADLSPALERALGLVTDKECMVGVPTPGGAQMPSMGDAAAADTVPLSFESTVFPPDVAHTLIVLTVTGQGTFWVTTIVGSEQGGQSLMRRAGGRTDVLLSDTMLFPIKSSDQIPAEVADELNKAAAGDRDEAQAQAGPPPQPGDDINAKMLRGAEDFVGHDTSGVPLTNGGSLACAWCVNEIARRTLGRPISTQGGQGNGLSTADLFAVLKSRHVELASADDAVPGTIIIAPSTPTVHGHVGIVGTTTGGVAAAAVFSNSSKRAQFTQNYTIASFSQTFSKLQVRFFALKADQF